MIMNITFKKKALFFNRLSLKHSLLNIIFLVVVAYNTTAIAQEHLFASNSPYFIEYWQTSPNKLEVNIRYLGEPTEITGKLKIGTSQEIPSGEILKYPRENDKTAILFLVDVSADKTRKRVIKKNIQQIQTILSTGKQHQLFGLATFGEKFTVLSAIGTDKEKIKAETNKISANEKETLLYQHTGKAIDLLNQQDVTRRILIIFSDGKTEDQITVYNHQHVINKTNDKKTQIIGLAFPPKNTIHHQIRDYQTLEKLADSTDGLFYKANSTGDLQGVNLSNLLKLADNGGYWSFDLTPLNSAERSSKIELQITNQGQTRSIPLQLANSSTSLATGLTKPQQITALIILILLLLGLLAYLIKRKNTKTETIYAYINSLDGNQRYAINKRTYKIGRNPENDLVLSNQSVSSFHAQIHITRDNEFVINDLQSTNGIVINDNDETISSAILNDGDQLEIGEVRLRFNKQ